MNFDDLILWEKNNKIVLLNKNTLTWVKIDKKYYNDKIKNDISKESFIKFLDNKFNILSDLDGRKNSSISSVYFLVTKKCNMSCSFCTMNSNSNTTTKNDLTLSEIENKVIPKLLKLNPRKIVISGGEPFIRNDIVQIIKLFSDNFGKNKISIQTNGTLLTKEILDQIQDLVSYIELSIESIFENKKQLYDAENLYEQINSYNIKLSFSFVVNNDTLKYLTSGIDLCNKYNAYFIMRIMTVVGRASENRDVSFNSTTIFETYKIAVEHILKSKYYNDNIASSFIRDFYINPFCGAYGKIFSIDANGDVYMCGNFKDKKYTYGNIVSNSYDELVKEVNSKLDNEDFQKLFYVRYNSLCTNCDVKYFCSGHCPAEVKENSNNLEVLHSKCYFKKAMLEFSLFYYDSKISTEDNLTSLLNYIQIKLAKEVENLCLH